MQWFHEWQRHREPEVPALWSSGWAEAVLALFPALLHQKLFDWAVPSGNSLNLFLILGLLFLAETFTALASGLGDILGGLRSERLEEGLKSNLIERVLNWPQKALDSLGIGQFFKGLDDAAHLAGRGHALGALSAKYLPGAVTAIPMMFLVAWPLALLRIALLPLNWKLGGAFASRDQEMERAVWERSNLFHTQFQEAYEGLRNIKALSAENTVFRELRYSLLNVREKAGERRNWNAFWSFSAQLLAQFGSVLVFFTAAWMMANNHLSFGRFMAFQVLSAQGILSLGGLLGVAKTLFQTQNPKARYSDLLKVEIEKRRTPAFYIAGRPPLVQARQVSLKYPTGAEALRGVDLTLWPGERIAFVGPSGCGKSSLLQLILNLYPATGGRLLWDGIEYSQVSPSYLRKQMAVVLQDNAVFSNTIAHNLTLGDRSYRIPEMEEALERAGLLETVRDLPEGIHTLYGANGVKLSGGQKQRLALARAFLRKPRLLILDEATSALDNLTETFVQDSLAALDKNTSVITVAHRLSTVREASCIYVMESGRIVETGNHGSLLGLGGLYSRLHSTSEPEGILCN